MVPAAGWTSYPPLSVLWEAAPGSMNAQTLWLLAITFVGVSSMMGSVNYMTTIIQMRAPGMTMFRLPLTIWAMFITAMLQAFALPVLTAAGFMQLSDRLLGTGFFLAENAMANNSIPASGGGQPLLWQHLFWFYSHPAVYIMILPAMGMVSDIIACFARKPIFGYKPMVYSISGIAGLGFIVWGHHMFVSGMNPDLGMTFMVATMMIALPSAVKTFNWLGTIWGGKIQFTTPMLFALSFVSMFIIGGLSGIFMAATPVDIFIHDTYFIVAHFHYVLFAGTAMAVFGAIYFWFPKMFGRMMNEFWGKVHFFLTFIFLNGTFYTMHILGAVGFPRRLADPYHYETFRQLLPLESIHDHLRDRHGRGADHLRDQLHCQHVRRARSSVEIRGAATRWNGRHPVRRATATSISSPSSIAVPTSTVRPSRSSITIRRTCRRRRSGNRQSPQPELDCRDWIVAAPSTIDDTTHAHCRGTRESVAIPPGRRPGVRHVSLDLDGWAGHLVRRGDGGARLADDVRLQHVSVPVAVLAVWALGLVRRAWTPTAGLPGGIACRSGWCWSVPVPARHVVWPWQPAGLLLLVILQGILGGLRVRMNSRVLAQVHGIVGPLFFASVVSFAIWSRRGHAGIRIDTAIARGPCGPPAWMLFVLLLMQLLLGSQLRHVDGIDVG